MQLGSEIVELDLGDVTLSLRLLVKGQKRFGLRLRVTPD